MAAPGGEARAGVAVGLGRVEQKHNRPWHYSWILLGAVSTTLVLSPSGTLAHSNALLSHLKELSAYQQFWSGGKEYLLTNLRSDGAASLSSSLDPECRGSHLPVFCLGGGKLTP
eukprot:6196872-Pleurochrysis_carterae.AAC.3